MIGYRVISQVKIDIMYKIHIIYKNVSIV